MEIPVDTLIIGAGVIGSSVAMHLAERGAEGVRVLDFDLEGSLSSSELNAGGVRGTWKQSINVRMSQLSIEYFAKHADEVGYNPCGYLWLHRPESFESARKLSEMSTALGWPLEAWDIPELRRRVPFIDKTDDLAGAFFGPRDGLVNPNRVKNHFRERARAKGAAFEDRSLLRAVEWDAGGARVRVRKFPRELTAEQKLAIGSGQADALAAEEVLYRAKRVVNCAGPWAGEVARRMGYRSPAIAVRRQVCIFDSRDVDLTSYGMIVDPSGVYFHPEATNGLAGFANHAEPQGVNFHYDGDAFFMDVIWPALYERSTRFEKLKHLTGWAGLYEVSPDESAILGPVVAMEKGGAGVSGRAFEAHSFSGHGLMHSYAAGLALAELMQDGRYSTVDASELAAGRFESGRLVRETLVI